MNIGSVSVQNPASLTTTANLRATHASSPQPPSGLNPPPNEMSPMGQTLGRLAGLATQDPEAFKAAAAEIGAQLQELAESAGGKEGQHISALAKRFSEASESGDMSALAPPNGRPPGPPPQASAAYTEGRPSDGPSTEIRTQVNDLLKNVLDSL